MMTIAYTIFLYTFGKMNKDVLCTKELVCCIKNTIVRYTRLIMNYPYNGT